jgi:hypothetical protein
MRTAFNVAALPMAFADGCAAIGTWSKALAHASFPKPEINCRAVGIEKKVVVSRAVRSAYWLNHDPTGMVEVGCGPATK